MKHFNSSDFKSSEFSGSKTPEGLAAVLKRDGFKVQGEDAIASLNNLLKDPATSDQLLELTKENLLSREATNALGSKIFMENASWPLRPQEIREIIQANYPHEAPDHFSRKAYINEKDMTSDRMLGEVKGRILEKIRHFFNRR